MQTEELLLLLDDESSAAHSKHVDPSTIPLEMLAAIRGAMWPLGPVPGMALPFGPRPGQPDNIIATVFIADYAEAQQAAIIAELKARGYTHVVMGPLVDSDGYHGLWPPNDWRGANFERFLDAVQRFWDAGLAPIVFLHPDNWSVEQTRDELTPLLQQPRAQRLLRIVVPAGWEPGAGYTWSSYTWAAYLRWARETLPHALVLLHNAVKSDGSPYDAPVGTDALGDDNGKPNGEGWSRVAPYLHGFLIQFGPFDTAPSADPGLARSFAAQFMADGDGASEHGFRWHFVHGIAGWPTGSAWGPNVPLRLYAGEMTAYNRFWRGMSEADGVAWGDLAMRAGADGYLDGGTVPVPVRR